MSRFRAPWWIKNRHQQTIFPHIFRAHPRQRCTRERLELPDGDFLDIDTHIVPHRPIIFLLHGLEGSAQSIYILGLADQLIRAGMGVVAINMRSCSGELNRKPFFYHSGFTADIHYVVSLFSRRHPGSLLGGVGFSLGGNVLLKYLGEGASPLSAAVAVSVPVELLASTHRLSRGAGQYYERRFLALLKGKVRAKQALLNDSGIDVEATLNSRCFREFDNRLTAPTFGFEDAADYYIRSSSLQYLPRITAPTLLLQSLDDPLLAEACFPTAEQCAPSITREYTAQGGHVGFVHGSIRSPRYYAEERALDFLAAHLSTAPQRTSR